MSSARSAVFAGCARDCAPYLDGVLANMEVVARQFAHSAFVFVENDSSDATSARLSAFGERLANFQLLQLPGLVERHLMRSERLAVARNAYLDAIRRSPLREFDYLFVYDMDEMNAARAPVEPVLSAIEFLDAAPERAAVFANQTGYYYDLYALRHREYCPLDPWEEVFDYVFSHRVSDTVAFDATYAKRLFELDRARPPLEVDSAFGGLGIYRMHYALQGHYAGIRPKTCLADGRLRELLWQVCEHVAFNADIRLRGGRLFILPWLINASFGVAQLRADQMCPVSAFRSLYRLLD